VWRVWRVFANEVQNRESQAPLKGFECAFFNSSRVPGTHKFVLYQERILPGTGIPFVGTWCVYMMSREAIKFPAANFAYNLVQIALCAYMTISEVVIAVENGYSPICNRFVMTKQAPMARLLWLFYMSKYLDFCDTFFIVAGKKMAAAKLSPRLSQATGPKAS
jgi:hypothetical protein